MVCCIASLSAPSEAPMAGNAGKIASIENGPNIDRPASSRASRPMDLGRCGGMDSHRRAAGGRRKEARKNTGSHGARGRRAIIAGQDPPAGEAVQVHGPAAEGATPVIAQAHVPPAGTTLERPVKPGAEGAWGRVRAPPPNSQAKGQRGAP